MEGGQYIEPVAPARGGGLDPEPLAQAMTMLAQGYDGKRDFFFLNMSGIAESGNEIETKVWAKVDDYGGHKEIDRLVTLMLPEDY